MVISTDKTLRAFTKTKRNITREWRILLTAFDWLPSTRLRPIPVVPSWNDLYQPWKVSFVGPSYPWLDRKESKHCCTNWPFKKQWLTIVRRGEVVCAFGKKKFCHYLKVAAPQIFFLHACLSNSLKILPGKVELMKLLIPQIRRSLSTVVDYLRSICNL